MKTLTDALTKGALIGFNHARKNPTATKQEFLSQLGSLTSQIKNMSDADLTKIVDAKLTADG